MGLDRLSATLPVIGKIDLDFHNESAELLGLLGEAELSRLNRIHHLGLSSLVFTGVNHSRLEYVLLLCATAIQIAKLHKHNDEVGLSGKIKLNGIRSPISSCSELLKIWAFVTNIGHTNWTFGTEKTILNAAKESKAIYSWLTTSTRYSDMNRWCRSQIDLDNGLQIKHLLALKRVNDFPPRSKMKVQVIHYLRNLLLDPELLFPDNFEARQKLIRVRTLFQQLRLLVIVALDSYYSHHPLRLDLNSAINNIANFQKRGFSPNPFDDFLNQTAGNLADELYLHPKAMSLHRSYELHHLPKFISLFNRTHGSSVKRQQILRDLLYNGFGLPKAPIYKNLFRMSLPSPDQYLLGSGSPSSVAKLIRKKLIIQPNTELTTDVNPYTGHTHLDILYDPLNSNYQDIGVICCKLYVWLQRSLLASSLRYFRTTFQQTATQPPAGFEQVIIKYWSKELLDRDLPSIGNLFTGVLGYLLPENWSISFPEYYYSKEMGHPFGIKFLGARNFDYNTIQRQSKLLVDQLNPSTDGDKLHEINTTLHLVRYSKKPFTIVCFEKLTIRDKYGKPMRELDGVLLEISDTSTTLRIVEAKNIRHATARENAALKQLKETFDVCFKHSGIKYSRKRIKGKGAYLKFQLK